MNEDAIPHEKILNVPLEFSSAQEQSDCESILGQLTTAELEGAAQTSYVYWHWQRRRHSRRPDANAHHDWQRHMALREIRRHYRAHNGQVPPARQNLQLALAYRQSASLNLLRLCFSGNANNDVDLTDQEQHACANMRADIQADLARQTMVVRGHDRHHRAVLHKLSRTGNARHVNDSNADVHAYTAYQTAQIYVTERAVAATEVHSRGAHDQICVVFDFGTYQRQHAPPLRWYRATLPLLQQLYPERVFRLYILDAPWWMRTIYHIITPLLTQQTLAKVHLLTGAANKDKTIGATVDATQATPYMLSNGHLTDGVDVTTYLTRVPFHGLYDEHVGDPP